jgi:hypothetical protein
MADHPKPVKLWHTEIEQKDVRPGLIEHIHGFLSIARLGHLITAYFQQFAEQFPVHGIVFSKHNPGHDCPTALVSL